MQTLEKGVKYVQSLPQKHQNDVICVNCNVPKNTSEKLRKILCIVLLYSFYIEYSRFLFA